MLFQWLKQAGSLTLIFTFTHVVTRIINFVTLPLIASRLSLHQLGEIELLHTLFSITITIICSLSATGMIRFYYYHSDNVQAQHNSIGIGLWNGLITSCLSSIVLVSLIKTYFGNFNYPWQLLVIYGTNIITFSLFSLVNTYLRITHQLWWYVFSCISQNIIAASCTLLLVYHGYGQASSIIGIALSCVGYIPLFLLLLIKHKHINVVQLKQHFSYVIPLTLYGFLFSYITTIDKLSIARHHIELLGLYGILTRFGQIFALCSQACMDTWPMIIYNVYQQDKPLRVVPRLITAYATFLHSIGLTIASFSMYVAQYIMPAHTQSALSHMPLFFLSLIFLDSARVYQTPFNLINKMVYVPFIGTCVVALQAFFFYVIAPNSITMYLIINSGIFLSYALTSMLIANYVCKRPIIHGYPTMLVSLAGTFSAYLLWSIHPTTMIGHISILSSFPVLLIALGIVPAQDRQKIKEFLAQALLHYISKRNPIAPYQEIMHVPDHAYTKELYRQHILVLGPLPPPRGGVSIHIERTIELLKAQKNIVEHFDTITRPWPFQLYCLKLALKLLLSSAHILIYHTPYSYRSTIEFFILSIYAIVTCKKLIVVDHQPRYMYQKNKSEQILFNAMFLRAHKHIIIGNSTYKSYTDNEINVGKNAYIESPFVPPNINKRYTILSHYPQTLTNFMANHTPLISVNACSVANAQGVDIYGLDLSIELIKNIQPLFTRIGMVISYVQVFDTHYLAQLHAMIQKYNLVNHVYLFQNTDEFWPIIEQSTLFLRPNRSDSFGISIAEALYLKIPAVASDVCIRPNNTILFKNNNIYDLTYKVTHALSHNSLNHYDRNLLQKYSKITLSSL